MPSWINSLVIWTYCDTCKSDVTICPRCGKYTCNGGYGPTDLEEVKKILNGGTTLGIREFNCRICHIAHDEAIKHKWIAPPCAPKTNDKAFIKAIIKAYLGIFEEFSRPIELFLDEGV